MTHYPGPLPLPSDVQSLRAARGAQVVKAVSLGIYFRLGVIAFEWIGILFTYSSALFLDMLSSGMDIIASLFLICCLKLAQRPPDYNHPFGHGRYEPMGGLLLGIFLAGLGIALFSQQTLSVFTETEQRQIHAWAWIFPAFAMVILEIAYRNLVRTAKKLQSPSLIADAYHYRVDSLTSLFATLALVTGALWPEWSVFIDHAGAIIISLFMSVLGLLAAKDNFHQLMDRIPDSQFFDLVKEAALKVSGVLGTEKIRIQRYGPDAHVDIDIEVKPNLSVDKAHKISQKVRLEIQKAWPDVRDVTVHIEPFYPNDH